MWRWGYSLQKPLKRAYEQDPEAVEEWLEHTLPVAKTEGGESHGGISRDCVQMLKQDVDRRRLGKSLKFI